MQLFVFYLLSMNKIKIFDILLIFKAVIFQSSGLIKYDIK